MTTEPPHNPPEHRRRPDDGTTTVDLGRTYTGTVPAPRPAEPATDWCDSPHAEQHIRTRGKWLIISGVTATVLASVLAAVWQAGFGDDMPLAIHMPLQAFGLGGIALGCLEYLNRPFRRNQRKALERLDQVELSILQLVGLLDEDKQNAWYKGYAARTREQQTGTENARPLNEYRSGDVIRLRPRNDRA